MFPDLPRKTRKSFKFNNLLSVIPTHHHDISERRKNSSVGQTDEHQLTGKPWSVLPPITPAPSATQPPSRTSNKSHSPSSELVADEELSSNRSSSRAEKSLCLQANPNPGGGGTLCSTQACRGGSWLHSNSTGTNDFGNRTHNYSVGSCNCGISDIGPSRWQGCFGLSSLATTNIGTIDRDATYSKEMTPFLNMRQKAYPRRRSDITSYPSVSLPTLSSHSHHHCASGYVPAQGGWRQVGQGASTGERAFHHYTKNNYKNDKIT